MAINQINKNTVQDVCIAARDTKKCPCGFFLTFIHRILIQKNWLFPKKEKADCCEVIKKNDERKRARI